MMNYCIQVMLFQALFLCLYHLFLQKETFFTKNRLYLLFTAIVSFLIPLVRIPSLQKSVSDNISILLPQIVLSPQTVITQSSLEESVAYGSIIFWTGVVVFSLLFVRKTYQLFSLIRSNRIEKKEHYKLVHLSESKEAFSFFNWVFLGDQISSSERANIIQHELIHSRQKHSLDLLIFEILRICMWFNPLLYMYQRRVSMVHEYIADEMVVKSTSKKEYINQLINELFDVKRISFVNQFSIGSYIKRRIAMLSKQKSKSIMQLKYLLFIPLFAAMLFYISCSDALENSWDSQTFGKQKTTYYDAKGRSIMFEKMRHQLRKETPNKAIFLEEKETYFDYYFDRVDPPFGSVLSLEQLNKEELEEYHAFVASNQTNGYTFWSTLRIYQLSNGRKMLATIWDFSMDDAEGNLTNDQNTQEVAFSQIDQIPTFPNCAENDKACFQKQLNEHIKNHFDQQMVQNVGLSQGKQKVIIMFMINEYGQVENVKVRAPAKELKDEAMRVVKLLPQMQPGIHNGKTVKVQYVLPIALQVK
jgi:beta-lactamase regulating signal transducer with metallopeptidase domain